MNRSQIGDNSFMDNGGLKKLCAMQLQCKLQPTDMQIDNLFK